MKTFSRFFIVVIFFQFLFLGIFEANAFTKQEIITIANSLQKDLDGPLKKLDLTYNIGMYIHGRLFIKPMGYENNKEIQDNFTDAFSKFVESLFSKKFTNAKFVLDEKLINKWIEKYDSNEDKFTQYYEVFQNEYPFFKNITIVDMTKQILRFAIILNEFDPQKLTILMDFTGIWPFC